MSGVGKEFMQQTKPQNLTKADQHKGFPQPPLELDYPEGAETIVLPAVANRKIGKMAVQEAIETRKTIRDYSRYFNFALRNWNLSLFIKRAS